jgi:tetratricopeptide (TPR) repeat protein
VALIALLTLAVMKSFAVGALTDERGSPPDDVLSAAAPYFPDSARLNARLATLELGEQDRNLSLAEYYARRAVSLSPWDYNYRLELASIEDAEGDRAAAEGSLRSALAIAPNNSDVHWRLANLLLRLGKIEDSVQEFRKALVSNSTLLGASLDLMWRFSGGQFDRVEAVAGEDLKSRLVLAEFLLRRGQVSEAATVFKTLDRHERLESSEASAFLTTMVDSGRRTAARELWLDTVEGDGAHLETPPSLVWNGGFESDISRNFPQFDWNIRQSEYARITIASDAAHSGGRSLRVDFKGLDTTRIDGEIKQLVAIKAGRHYRLECYARSDNLVTPGGPLVAAVDAGSLRELATSGQVPAGSNDWVLLSCEFVAPEDCEAVLIQIKRIPRFSYDDPTRGTVWFDDFSLIETRNR